MSQHDFTPDKNLAVTKGNKSILHSEILSNLLDEIGKVDFREKVGLEGNSNLSRKHYLVTVIDLILELARKRDWGICQNNGSVYVFNGEYWNLISKEQVEIFLGSAAERMGVDRYDAKFFKFRDDLYRQFQSAALFPKPEKPVDKVLVNLKNGTFEFSFSHQHLREFNRKNFLTYQLPFNYDERATFPKFQKFLNRVLPDIPSQRVLSEFIAYLFVSNRKLKLEKALFLYGQGANGKSVFFEVITALLGSDNVSSFSLQSLTNESGYTRAVMGSKLVNYATEINSNLDSSILKQLISGEPVEARLPYGVPFSLTDYARLIFNCNELPRNVEHSHAYFRRLLIIAFDETIPEAEQNKELAKEIINEELSGVFNWVLEGMKRLLEQKGFTECERVRQLVDDYKKSSDNVSLFIEDRGYKRSTTNFITLKSLYPEFQEYCKESGCIACSRTKFSERLKNLAFVFDRKESYGFYLEK